MKDNPITIINGPGGCPFVTDPSAPHLGGNFDGGDEGTTYTADLWPWLVDTYKPRTILDLGCGTGESAAAFRLLGANVIGLDGLGWNAVQCGERHSVPCIVWDLTKGPLRIEGIDLVWCSDVAEHIEEKYLPNLFNTLRHAKRIAMCQGLESSGPCGWHHVTNKPEAWWVEKLAEYGIEEVVEDTVESRKVGNHGWWAKTGRIYRAG